MRLLSARRLGLACIISAAIVVAAVAPGAASAASDLGQQCSGVEITGRGSSFQNTLLQKWVVEYNKVEILKEGKLEKVPNKNTRACGGTQGDEKEAKVKYLSGGSGACLHAWGTEKVEEVKFKETDYCGTDEAPNATQRFEIEGFKKEGGEGESLETIPVAQGADAIIVHLPTHCVAESEIEKSGIKYKLGRLVLDDSTLEGIYRGTIKTWKQLIANQKAGHDALACKGGSVNIKIINENEEEEEVAVATGAQEEEQVIRPVVRLDHGGTTHIFKTWLEQVNNTPTKFEALPEERGGKKIGCGKPLPEEERIWSQTAEGCENQRWPTATHVLFGTIAGNPGMEARVSETPSSIAYPDLGSAREDGFWSKKCPTKVKPPLCGGENKKGTSEKVGEQNTQFWAEVQDTATPSDAGYYEPSSDGDVEKPGQANCKASVYTNTAGKKFPPETTRQLWNGAKAETVSKEYGICGLTYDLLLRQYAFYPGLEGEEGKALATGAHDFLYWALSSKPEGGSALIKGSDYEKVPTNVQEIAEDGVEEVGFETAGTSK